MRTIFDQLIGAYAKYYNPSEHSAVNEVVLLKVGLFSNSIYQRNTNDLG
jgi:hypothetical protein